MSALSEDLAAKGHVDGRERMGLDVLSLVVQLLIEQLIQSVVHALGTIVSVHFGAGRLPWWLWGPACSYPVASPLSNNESFGFTDQKPHKKLAEAQFLPDQNCLGSPLYSGFSNPTFSQ